MTNLEFLKDIMDDVIDIVSEKTDDKGNILVYAETLDGCCTKYRFKFDKNGNFIDRDELNPNYH